MLFQGKRGSIVAIEPKTGEVLVFVNKPDFDPNELVGKERNKAFRKMLIDPKKPLYNRAVKGVYPPGSTVKTVLALIGMQEGIIVPSTRKGCAGGYHMGSIVIGCHGHPSPLDVVGSIQISCNAYYCDLFRQIIDHPQYGNVHEGYRVLEKHWRSFGLGNPTGIDLLGEAKGNIPSVEGLAKRHGKKWRS
jgi:penicillin-binding protein 2